ncbi:hypothetical protein F2P56_011110 [Juglans regia]|uniref:Uncharacterized protein LOC109021881 n=2 Tax=Juglans regia TaxID=51240 RepID=A0A2I4HVK3_JUGRE|nr:uncharacterized protein LOC109021881 [Juglans regia]KAF5470606.1 hypothetical protein F2P56_011110 [Juglans regia]
MKSFLWRAASESLATNLNLHKRKVVVSPHCPICFMHPESVAHALWTCLAAQDVWSMSFRRIQKLCMQDGSFKEILMPMLDQLSLLELIEIAVIAKAVWHRRNYCLFEQHFHPPIQMSKQVLSELNAIGTWLENLEKRIKVQANWDAAKDKGNSRLGIGVIVRDLDGYIIVSLCSSIPLTPDPFLGEAVATLRATSLHAELGLHQFILEGDSLGVVKAIQQGNEIWSSTGMVIRDIKVLLSKVRGWSIQHVPRKVNVIARVLAKFALTCLEDYILIEDYPPCIHHLL